MTMYEMNYRDALNKMLDDVVHSYGHESHEAIKMARAVDKYINNCCYQNWDIVEQLYKGILRRG